MAQINDILSAVYQIADNKGLDKETVLEIVKEALLTAFRKENPTKETLSVELDEVGGEFTILADKTVVDEVTESETQISLADAQKIESKLRIHDHIQMDVTPESFGRIAAQAAGQRIYQAIYEAEREAGVAKFKDKIGEIVTGIIQKVSDGDAFIEIDRVTAIMPRNEQIPGEYYRLGNRMRFLLQKVQNHFNTKTLILSRGSVEFLKALFSLEVPEIASGTVEIKSVAREPGSRSKFAVTTTREKIDPIGACVGPKGARINVIMDEITPEKVDIILWDESESEFVKNALSPAKVLNVKVDKENKLAKVLVSSDILSLAIGKDGQNVRLAAKLTGYRIDISDDESIFNDGFEKMLSEKPIYEPPVINEDETDKEAE